MVAAAAGNVKIARCPESEGRRAVYDDRRRAALHAPSAFEEFAIALMSQLSGLARWFSGRDL
jgi:hypothetical protein